MSPKDKKFVNPLLRPTEAETEASTQPPTELDTQATTEPSTSSSTEPATEAQTQTPTGTSTSADTETSTFTSTHDEEDDAVERRKRGKQAFDKTHDRWTLWVRKKQKRQVKQLAKEQEVSYVALIDEAIADLLKKYGK